MVLIQCFSSNMLYCKQSSAWHFLPQGIFALIVLLCIFLIHCGKYLLETVNRIFITQALKNM